MFYLVLFPSSFCPQHFYAFLLLAGARLRPSIGLLPSPAELLFLCRVLAACLSAALHGQVPYCFWTSGGPPLLTAASRSRRIPHPPHHLPRLDADRERSGQKSSQPSREEGPPTSAWPRPWAERLPELPVCPCSPQTKRRCESAPTAQLRTWAP